MCVCVCVCVVGISFTPREVGDHWVSVYRNSQPIAGSPFKVVVGQSEIGNASKVRTGGRGLIQGMANQTNEFLINTRDAGSLHWVFISLSLEFSLSLLMSRSFEMYVDELS